MAEIILHAGMPKTGSTSVQRWLIDNAEMLRATHGLQLLVATNQTAANPTREVHVEPYESGGLNSGLLVYAWAVDGRGPAVPRRFANEVAAFAARNPRVLVTAEAASQFFWRLDDALLGALDDLSHEHTVRVAYYVRPQHAALESWWCEAGFRQAAPPAAALTEKAKELHYLHTLVGVQERAPGVDFVVRPFRADLLDGGNVVEDFARRFAGFTGEVPDVRANRAMPLGVVNALRLAPDGLFWDGDAERYPRRALKAAVAQLEYPERDAVRRSRLVLQAWSHREFEAENQELIRRLSWAADEFVPSPAVARDAEPAGLGDIDELWSPPESPLELDRLYDRLQALLRTP